MTQVIQINAQMNPSPRPQVLGDLRSCTVCVRTPLVFLHSLAPNFYSNYRLIE